MNEQVEKNKRGGGGGGLEGGAYDGERNISNIKGVETLIEKSRLLVIIHTIYDYQQCSLNIPTLTS